MAGLIEGDEHIAKSTIKVSFDTKDRINAENLVYTWGELVTDNINQSGCAWVLNRQALNRVIELINGRLVENRKVSDLKKHFPSVVIKPLLLKVNFNSAWLSGFFEADGHVGINVKKEANGCLSAPNVGYVFSQKDHELLNLILLSHPAFSEQTLYKQSAERPGFKGLGTN